MSDAQGLLSPGTIDLHARPRVSNADGTFSTVRSIGINVDGHEVLIPTVSDDGRVLSNDDAIQLFRQTGKHLGVFDTPAHATAYAKHLHEDQAKEYAMPEQQEVVIVDGSGTEHVFPAGFDPKKAAAIVRASGTAQAPEAPKGDLGRFGGYKQIGDAVISAGKYALDHPVQAGATLGGFAAAPFTGGASVVAAGLGAAGGAGLGEIVDQFRHGPKSPAQVATSMATEGAAGAAGQGIANGAAQLLKAGGKLVYKAALRPSMGLQREFGDVAATGLREGAPVGEGGAKKIIGQIKNLSEQTRGILTAKDAARPPVRGYLPPARETIPLGAAPTAGEMPIRVTGSQPIPLRRGPILSNGKRAIEHIPGDPIDTLHSSFLDETGHVPGPLPSPELSGPGVLLRDNPTLGGAGRGAYPQMIAPEEIAGRGLKGAKAELSDRALAGDATGALDDLQRRFLEQRGSALTLTEAQRLKQAEQALSDASYRSEQMGHPVNGIDAQFHKGIARGAREAIEQRAPEVGPLNKKTQQLIGLSRALEDATRRNVPGVGSLRTFLGDFMPNVASRGAIGADRVGRSPVTAAALRTALMEAIGQLQQD